MQTGKAVNGAQVRIHMQIVVEAPHSAKVLKKKTILNRKQLHNRNKITMHNGGIEQITKMVLCIFESVHLMSN